jgi:cellulose synthase/poly-beta-1,6-N-acetylglucosamine synthase-like glycosyltransferase
MTCNDQNYVEVVNNLKHHVSVIITAKNEANTIKKAIHSFADLKGKIIVIAPDKKTLGAARNDGIEIIEDEGCGKPSALNLGLSRVKDGIVILTDGDVWTSNSSALIPHFKDPKVGLVCGRPISTNSHKSVLGVWSHILMYIAHKIREKRKGSYIDSTGYLYAIRRSLVKKMPDNILADDAFISQTVYRQGYKIVYEPDAEVFVKFPKTFSDWVLQKKRTIGGYNQLRDLGKGSPMRGFRNEAFGIFLTFSYPKNPFQFCCALLLILARLYVHFRVFTDIRIKKEPFYKVWRRVQSTKDNRDV